VERGVESFDLDRRLERILLSADPALDIGEPAIGDHAKPLLPATQFALAFGIGELKNGENADRGRRWRMSRW